MRDIKILHLESTDVCQASCPLCAREVDPTFDKTQYHHLSMDKILQVISANQIAQLDKMFMCGNYGDPAAGLYSLDVYREFRRLNPSIVLGMNTNGAIRNELWWQELANIFNQPQDYVVFSIDGLNDTNDIYRRGVDWSKLITNVSAFIAAGGSAHWDMLVYQHNQHQVNDCKKLAQELGFSWFRAKVSHRPLANNLQFPSGWQRPSIYSTDIKCSALLEKSAFIDAHGRMSPCCWIGGKQKNIQSFNQIQDSWTSDHPNPTCVKICGTKAETNNFTNQWQQTIKLK